MIIKAPTSKHFVCACPFFSRDGRRNKVCFIFDSMLWIFHPKNKIHTTISVENNFSFVVHTTYICEIEILKSYKFLYEMNFNKGMYVSYVQKQVHKYIYLPSILWNPKHSLLALLAVSALNNFIQNKQYYINICKNESLTFMK